MAGRVAPEVERRVAADRCEALDEFRRHVGLEDGAAQRVRLQRGRILDAEQVARQARVQEMQPGTLAEPLAVVRVVGWKGRRHVAGFERRQPAARRLVRDPRVRRQAAEVEFGGGAGGRQAGEGLERSEVQDLGHLAQVAVDVRAKVVGQPVAGVQASVVDRRKEAGEERLPRIGAPQARGCPNGRIRGPVQAPRVQGREPVQLGDGERIEREDGGSPRQRLRHRLHEQDVLRSRHDEPARTGVVVHEALDVGEEFGRPLDLVEDQGIAPRKEPARIRQRPRAHVGCLQRRVPIIGEHRPHERGLPGLPRAGERHHGVT